MIPEWPRAYEQLGVHADIKIHPEDFIVEEQFDLEPSDDGEFNWLWVQKSGLNTEEVASLLARHANIPRRAVSYSGLKDRHALTRQWFCLHLAGKGNPDWSALSDVAGLQILKSVRHRKKLRHGAHRGNQFVLVLRGEGLEQSESLDERLQRVAGQGVPNYFGEQRFGREGGNLEAARHWLADGGAAPKRFLRGLYLSAARSYLFNQVLAQRVTAGNWNRAIDGDVFALRDSNSVFREVIDDTIRLRIKEGDIHPTGPLCGKPGELEAVAEAARLEDKVFESETALCEGLIRHNVDAARRSLRLLPQAMTWNWQEGGLCLSFALKKGCFATAVVRELVCYRL